MALSYSEKFLKDCDEIYEIRLQQLNIHKVTKDYKNALKDIDIFLEKDPYDKDFWAWKGEIYEKMADYDLAIQSYRESIKLVPDVISLPLDLIELYKKTKHYCEAYQELERYTTEYPEIRNESKIRYMFNQLEGLGNCEREYSKGEAIIKFRPGASAIFVKVKFNDSIDGTFIVDTGATNVVLTKSFSQKIETSDELKPILFSTANGLSRGFATSVKKIAVKGVSSNNVPVNINSIDIPGADGLLGMSFLSRFHLELNNEKGTLHIKQKLFKNER